MLNILIKAQLTHKKPLAVPLGEKVTKQQMEARIKNWQKNSKTWYLIQCDRWLKSEADKFNTIKPH